MRSKLLLTVIGLVAVVGVLTWTTPGRCDTWPITQDPTGVSTDITITWEGVTKTIGASLVQFESNPVGIYTGTHWVGYCVDLLNNFDQPMVGELTWRDWGSYAGNNGAYTAQKLYNSAWLLWEYDPTLAGYEYSGYDHNLIEAALQLAIWENVWETSGDLDVTGGSVEFNLRAGVTSAVWAQITALANLMVGSLDGAPWWDFGATVLLTQDNDGEWPCSAQDLMLGTPDVPFDHPTPEPATMLLFASASGAFLMFRRKILK